MPNSEKLPPSRISGSDDVGRSELYEHYVTTHFAGLGGEGAATTLKGQILRLLPEDRGARIVDVGCGSGQLLRLLRARGYTRISGVDMSAEQVALASADGDLEVTHGELADYLSSTSAEYDAIVAVDLLEHLGRGEIVPSLRMMRSALGPGGRLVARVPNAQSPFGGRYRYGDFTHETSFTQHSISQILLAAGFGEIRVAPAEPVVHGIVSGLRLVLWKMIAGLLKLALAAETGILRGHVVTQNLLVVARAPSPRPAASGQQE